MPDMVKNRKERKIFMLNEKNRNDLIFQFFVFIVCISLVFFGIVRYMLEEFLPIITIMFLLCTFVFYTSKAKDILKKILSEKLKSLLNSNSKKMLIVSGISIVGFVLLAYGFAFSNEFFSHDSLAYMDYENTSPAFYTGVGRFFIIIYEVFKGSASIPWINGFLFSIWMFLSCYLVLNLLETKSLSSMCITTGVLCTNITLILGSATYITWLDDYAFALLFAILGVFFSVRYKFGFLLGGFFFVLSLSIYQAYFSVAVALYFLLVIKMILQNKCIKSVIKKSISYVATLISSVAIYYVIWTALCWMLGVGKLRTDETLIKADISITMIADLIFGANIDFANFMLGKSSIPGIVFATLNILLLIILAIKFGACLLDKNIAYKNKIFLVLAFLVTPTALASMFVIGGGIIHGLMTYSYSMIYVLIILLFEHSTKLKSEHFFRVVMCFLICFVIWETSILANQIYMKKNLEKTATLSVVTRVIDRIEAEKGYIPGETPVIFIGRLNSNPNLNKTRYGYQHIYGLIGDVGNYAVTYHHDMMRFYINDYLNYPLNWDPLNWDPEFASNEQVIAMKPFPNESCVQMIDGRVVVKLSDW